MISMSKAARPIRICFVCNEYPPGPHGGIGTFNCVLARSLAAAGHDVRVIGMYRHDYPAADYEVDQGVRVWRMRRSPRRFGWLSARYRLHRTIGRWCKNDLIDIVEFPDFEGWAAGMPRFPLPVIVRLNGSASYFAKELRRPLNRTTFYFERAGLRRADFWSSVSKYTAERTKEVFELSSGPHGILYNSVEVPREESSSPRSDNQIVYTGTLSEKKGILSLICAWPRVCSAVENAELHVYGKDGRTDDGESMQGYLQRQVEESGGNVHFHGHVSRQTLFGRLHIARAAVFPSYAEAFALAPLEAMVRGCPTVYSTRGSGTELINHGQDGLLVDPDQPDEIAEALITLLTDQQLADQLGKAGQQRVLRQFTVDTMRRQNEAFYRECIESFAGQSDYRANDRAGHPITP